MRDLKGKVAWITGAGSGIGAGTALAYAGAGMRLVLSGRREAELQQVAALVAQRGGSARVAPWTWWTRRGRPRSCCRRRPG